MALSFTKMHGLGNDFVVFDAINQDIALTTEQIRFIADRRLGVGCDQVLLVERPRSSDTDFFYRIFNADGEEVEQCGNGARCFARYVREKGLSNKASIPVGTISGNIRLSIETDGLVTVNMGPPVRQPGAIPFVADEQSDHYEIDVDNRILQIGALSMGNPHAVLRVDDAGSAEVSLLGPAIEQHVRFPNRVNAGFMQVIDRENIVLRVWERGVGETRACGTGACAAVVSGVIQGWLGPRVVVNLQGGQLVIHWQGDSHPVFMTGPAESVFEGTIQL